MEVAAILQQEMLRDELDSACQRLMRVGMWQAGKWCAEALAGLADENERIELQEELVFDLNEPEKARLGGNSIGNYNEASFGPSGSNSISGASHSDTRSRSVPNSGPNMANESYLSLISPSTHSLSDEISPSDHPKLLLASTYFACKEFERAASVLQNCQSGDAIFLRLYSIMISVDKKGMEETDGMINLGSDGGTNGAVNDSSHSSIGPDNDSRLSKILQEAETFHSKHPPNPLILYLIGVIYNKKKKYALAQTYLYKSAKLFPYNWSCWQELIASLTTLDEAMDFIRNAASTFGVTGSVSVSGLAGQGDAPTPLIQQAIATGNGAYIMFSIFQLVLLQSFHQNLPTLNSLLTTLLIIFPKFSFLKVQQFLIAYHSLDYFTAENIFDFILLNDPLRLDDLDTYSNMLYVMEKRSKLSFLAQFASLVDKFRPETCCIIANYHSMKCEHEKAIMYYKRALTLNKNCLSAWTLMGHEFVELKNSHAAIESYRRAVDTNPKDFRAWYGLGQAYEVLDMHLYALYYYQRATNLQPLDKRMWLAIGNCYEKIDKLEEAIKSFEKALAIDTYNDEQDGVVDPIICYRLAIISEKLGTIQDTHKYMKLCFDQEFEWGITEETSKARLWLARNALENRSFEEAYELAKDLNHSNAHDIEEARSIAREARNRMK